MSLTEDVRKLVSSVDEDGKLNILYSDIYYRIYLERRYGKEAVDREYNRLKRRIDIDSWYDDKSKERSDKEGVEALKSKVRRLEKDVKWLKKVVREITGTGNE